jgi:hypothetical protein
MDFYTCRNCNQQVSLRDREYHEMSCNNSFRAEELEDMIPCEICGNLINYNDYSRHLERCYSFTMTNNELNTDLNTDINSAITNLQNIMDNFNPNVDNNSTNNNNEENENENMEVDSDDEMPPLISDNELNDNNDNNENNENNNLFGPYIFNNVEAPEVGNILNAFITNLANSGIPINIDIHGSNGIGEEGDTYTELTNLSRNIGNVEIGIDEPEDYFKKTVNIGFKCPICYSTCDETMITECGHEICVNCTKEWYTRNKKCVVCMNELKKIV